MNYELLGAKVYNFYEIAKGLGQKSDFFAIFLVYLHFLLYLCADFRL